MKKLFMLLVLSFFSAQSLAGSCPDGSEPVKSISDDGTYFVFNCESDPKINVNAQESGAGSAASSSIFVSDKDFNDFLNLPKEVRISSCGYKGFSPNWREINKDLAPRIKGYNSKMDNWRKVEGAYSRDVLVKYLEASTYAMVSDDEALKEKLFDKLYQWASKNALSATMQCYSNGPKGVLPACEGEWSDPDGQDIAPIKDATVAVETVMSLNYLYKLYYADYKPEDDKHKAILGWFESFYPRIKASKDFYFGNSVGWHFPNISIKHSLNKDYKSLIQNMVNGLDEWSFADGSMKERTTRGNRALWYHSNALGEAFIILEIARIAEVEIPPTLEKKLLKAAELFNDAFLDHSVIEPWAKKRVRSQASNGRQEFNSNLDSISFYSSWMQIFQLRYPDHRTAKWLDQELTSRARSLKSNEITGVPIGCISKALADSYDGDSEIKITESKNVETSKINKSKMLEGGIRSSNINFPGKFYSTEISACKALVPISFSLNSSINFVKGLVGYDWHADWKANSNSMNVYHQKITEPMNMLMAATHNALGNDNQANINIAKNLLIELAKTDTLYDSIGYIEVKKKPGCYAGGDINAPCWYHEYQFASNVFSNYMITAIWLRDELNEQEFEIVDKYIKKMYKKFLQPIELKKEEQGFYAMANGGTSILAFASWTNDKELAAEEIDHRFQEMDRLFYDDGYINNNSFRGYRGQWYHSYGLDIALGYVYIAQLWGAEVPEKLQNKLVKAAEVANLAITDWNQFKSRKYSGENHNAIDDPNNAVKHTHQMAIAIDTLMKIVTDVELESDPMYLQKRKYQIGKSYGIDELIGFPPNCTIEALAINPEVTSEKIKLEQAKPILDAGEIHIVDGVQYQIEGQILKVYTGDSKMKPLNRNMGGLMMKCGSGLITGKKKDWLSFVSNESNDIKKARNKNCHYQYFQKSKDSEAFDLFKVITSKTDSILNQLEKK